MPRSKDQEEGLQFETDFARLFGAELRPGSGNQWYAKLDVRGRAILWSLKHTGAESLSVTRSILREAIQEATKLGSPGTIPGVAVDICGESFTLLRSQDLALILQEDIRIAPPQAGDIKRARASLPLAVRKQLEEENGSTKS